MIRDIMYASSSRYHPHIISYCVQSVETHANVPHILHTNSCGAVDPAWRDLLQPRLEGSRRRFADQQARAAAAANRKPRYFGGRRNSQQPDRQANPVGSVAGGSGTRRHCDVPSPSLIGGNADEGDSLRPIRNKKETNEKRG
jgi:hypothetical protein